MARVTRQDLQKADPTFAWKLFLRVSSIIAAVIAIGLIAWAELHIVVPVFEANNIGSTTPWYPGYQFGGYKRNEDDLALPWEFITLVLSIVWSVVNIAAWFTPSRSGRGVHPGANVGCDLVLWLALFMTGFVALVAVNGYIVENNEYPSGDYAIRLANGTFVEAFPNGTQVTLPNECAPFKDCDARANFSSGLRHKGIVIAVGVTFTFIIMLFHFALFISACRYTHARRARKDGHYAKARGEDATDIALKIIKDMGYRPPGEWQSQPQSFQPTLGAESQGRERYQEQLFGTQQQPEASFGNGNSRVRDLEQGQGPLGSLATIAGDRSSGQHLPNIRVETPGGGEAGMIR